MGKVESILILPAKRWQILVSLVTKDHTTNHFFPTPFPFPLPLSASFPAFSSSTKAFRSSPSPSFLRASSRTSSVLTVERPACLINGLVLAQVNIAVRDEEARNWVVNLPSE